MNEMKFLLKKLENRLNFRVACNVSHPLILKNCEMIFCLYGSLCLHLWQRIEKQQKSVKISKQPILDVKIIAKSYKIKMQ